MTLVNRRGDKKSNPTELGVESDRETTASDGELAGRCELTRSVLALLKVMKLWGIYFERTKDHDCYVDVLTTGDVNAPAIQGSEKKDQHHRLECVHAVCLLVVLWINVARLFTLFTASDRTLDVRQINKIVYFAMSLQCAVTHTSYFVISHKGQLNSLLHNLRITPEYAVFLKKRCTLTARMSYVVFAGNVALMAYTLFCNANNYDYLLTPLVTRISVGGTLLIVAKVFFLLIDAITKQAFFIPLIMNYILTIVLLSEFRALNACFRRNSSRHGAFRGQCVGQIPNNI